MNCCNHVVSLLKRSLMINLLEFYNIIGTLNIVLPPNRDIVIVRFAFWLYLCLVTYSFILICIHKYLKG